MEMHTKIDCPDLLQKLSNISILTKLMFLRRLDRHDVVTNRHTF